ncbi:hypothetical protein [Bacteriovorax sp. Seq25_V]|uniref:hypothetical protein n=1 Tax=Bacteriovorax sp. Seq25_V TaxID=1201288 RepID=UPI00038A453E|nr:hypothetical protein [Bacteriovorax sp. Seq25_V]EQC46539.1 hypothetical protein M900_2456 [Bacteriovorax sp. Seq25_V]
MKDFSAELDLERLEKKLEQGAQKKAQLLVDRKLSQLKDPTKKIFLAKIMGALKLKKHKL